MLESLAEIETRAEAARMKFRAARTNLARASTPANILGAGLSVTVSGVRSLAPEAFRITSKKAGASLANMAVGALGTVLAARFASRRSESQSDSTRGLPEEAAASQSTTSQKSQRAVGLRLGAMTRTFAAGAFAWYVGHVLSRQLKPTAFERELVGRYGEPFGNFVNGVKADLPRTLLHWSGISGKASSALIALSAIAALFKEFGGKAEVARTT